MGRRDKYDDDHWPVGFDRNGWPNVVGFIADVAGFVKKFREDDRRRRRAPRRRRRAWRSRAPP